MTEDKSWLGEAPEPGPDEVGPAPSSSAAPSASPATAGADAPAARRAAGLSPATVIARPRHKLAELGAVVGVALVALSLVGVAAVLGRPDSAAPTPGLPVPTESNGELESDRGDGGQGPIEGSTGPSTTYSPGPGRSPGPGSRYPDPSGTAVVPTTRVTAPVPTASGPGRSTPGTATATPAPPTTTPPTPTETPTPTPTSTETATEDPTIPAP